MACRLFAVWAVLVSLLSLPGAALAAPPDACGAKLDPALARLLESRFPRYRVPHLTDLDQEAVAFDRKGGGDGCLAVATDDFDGDGRQDVAIILLSRKSDKALLVAALRRRNSWRLSRLPTFCPSFRACYVKPEKPGTYTRTLALDGPPDGRNERARLSSRHASILSGKLESTGIVHVHTPAGWRYVWVSD